MATTVAMLTTMDNPWNPFDNWDEWYAFDEYQGYHTCGLLARYSLNTTELSELDQELEHRRAIEAVLETFPFSNWIIIRSPKQESLDEELSKIEKEIK